MNSLEQYNRFRHLIKTGDMLEWRAKSFIGGAIRFFTGKNVNHTSLCVALDKYLDYPEPHKFILEADKPGIVLNFLSRSLSCYDGEVWWSPLKNQFDNQRDDICRWAMLQVGTPYDYGNLFKNIFGAVSADAKKFFCSEFYFMALKHVGIVDGKKAPRPGEFDKFKIHSPAVRIL